MNRPAQTTHDERERGVSPGVGLRLLIAVIALAAGVAAVILTVLLVHTVLSV